MNIRKALRKVRRVLLKSFKHSNTSLTVIISAVLLLELMMGFMFYSAQAFIQRTMERMVGVEMNAIYLCIRNKLANVEVTIDNMSWVVGESLDEPSWMFQLSKEMLMHNPSFWGSGVAFTPHFYSGRAKFFEPYAVRRGDSILTMQVGRSGIDHTKKEYYRIPVEEGRSHWSEPYVDSVGAMSVVTTYSTPIRDTQNHIVGVTFADITTNWLEDVLNEEKVYASTQRLLVTGHYNRLAGKETPVLEEVLKLLKEDNDLSDYFMLESKDGVKHHVFYTPVGGKTNWVLINILDDNEVFGRLRFMRMMMLLPLVLGLFFAGIIVWRTSHNLKHLRQVNAEKERIDSELQVASQIQQNMLPQGDVHFENLEIEGFLKPAREVGGDVYDYFFRDEKLFFCIGDVSGKGAPSAMLMTVVHALFRLSSAHESNPARIMQIINEVACQNGESNMFVTLFIGVLDMPTGHLRYCDAGHDAPFVLPDTASSTAIAQLPVNPHLPVGVFDDTKYVAQEIDLQEACLIFLYTDGLTEARNAAHKLFGLKRVESVLNDCIGSTPENTLDTIVQSVDDFVKDAEQSDDLTMLAVRYIPHRFESILTETLVIKNEVHEVKRLSEFLKSVSQQLDVSTSVANKLRLAVEEAVVNVIDYAYPVGTEGDITIRVLSDGKTVRTQIVDKGQVFDPTAMQRADTTLSAEERNIGGLGILLVREQMDSINYERTDGKNVLTLIKKIK